VIDLLIFLLILSLVVLIHEWGHYISARKFGITVEEFGFGFPPRAAKLFVRKGTLFSLNWLPIGGFVRLKGEDPNELLLGGDVFYKKPAWQRAVILTAGVFMNFVLAIFLFGVVYSFMGIPTETDKVLVVGLEEESPAVNAGIELDEQIKKIVIEDKEYLITDSAEMAKLTNSNKGKEVVIFVGDREVVVTLQSGEGKGALGVMASNIEMVHFPWWQMPFRGAYFGMKEAVSWGGQIVVGLGDILTSIFTGRGVPEGVSGPVGIYKIGAQVYKIGILPTLQFVGILSVNLAILNILPFPALDGGRLIFLAVEKIIGVERKNKIEGVTHAVGMVLLLGLMILITVRDVIHLF
jgi:regulator of sigma E protease